MWRTIVTIMPVVMLLALGLQGCGSGQDGGSGGTESDTTKTSSDQTTESSTDKEEEEQTIKNKVLYQRLEEIIGNAKKQNCSQFGSYLIYTGDDKKRKFTDRLNMQNQAEKYRAESTCKAINSWLNESNSYDYGEYRLEGHSQLDTIYRQEVVFNKQTGSNRRVFTFMKDDGEYYLMNIK